MDDQYRMIEQAIDALLDENQDVAITLSPIEEKTPVTMRPANSFLPYKCLEVSVKEPLILGQYSKWSTVESDELNVQHVQHQPMAEQQLATPMVPAYNLTLEMWQKVQNMQNFLLNLCNAQIRQNLTMTKRTCSFCKKNGMNIATYTSHSLRVNGVLQCPYLLRCQCTHCYHTGHTTSYCPMKERTTTAPGLAFPFIDRNPVNRYNSSY